MAAMLQGNGRKELGLLCYNVLLLSHKSMLQTLVQPLKSKKEKKTNIYTKVIQENYTKTLKTRQQKSKVHF